MRRSFIAVDVVLAALAAPRAQSPAYDILIKHARIVDGTGSPWYRADLAIRGDAIAKMRVLVRQGMEDGAYGLSSGLFYVPGTFTPTAEVVELAKVAGRMGGIYISHMRDEASNITKSVEETIEIGEKGGLPTQVTHHKIIGKNNWGKSVDTLRLIDEARARGIDATIDQYPYTASSTSIQAALVPAWALEGGRAEILKRLQASSMRAEIRRET